MDSSGWIATGVVAGSGLIALLLAVGALALQAGPRRAALVAGLAPAALVPPAGAVALAGLQLSRLFESVALAGSGGAAPVLAGTQAVWLTVRVGFGLLALVSLVGLLGGLLRFGAAPEGAPECSPRRAIVLTLIPVLALLLAAVQARELRQGLTLARAVVADVGADAGRQAAVEAWLASQGLGVEGTAGIAEVSRRLALAISLAGLGGGVVLVVLTGLTLTGAILAWPVRVGPVFVTAASGLWLLLALAGALLALGLGAPPSF